MKELFYIKDKIIKTDKELIENALKGDKFSLESLIKRHQPYIYNVAWKMTLNPEDAEDITQEVLIKSITNLSKFQFKSSFQTWLYRITFNHFLKMKKSKPEFQITSFEEYGNVLESVVDENLSEQEKTEFSEYIEDVKISCMSGMLLCLDRDERLIYILGEIFNANNKIVSQILEISADNFRQKLSRARKNLKNFMHNKCGLINKNNPCRCHKKTKGFIKNGWVNTKELEFNITHKRKIYELSETKSKRLCESLDDEYAVLFSEHPVQEKFDRSQIISNIINDNNIKDIFNLN